MNHLPLCQVHTAETRPDLWDALKDENHPLNQAWPLFLDQDLSQQHFTPKLLQYRGLRKFQFAVVELDQTGHEILVACARSVPFFWPELEEIRDGNVRELSAHPDILQSLPDGGWDTIISRGIRQYCFRENISTISPIFTQNQEQDSNICATALYPNALSALSITVREDRRMLGLAERLVEAMKQVAKEERLQVLVAPLRPTRKSEVAFERMEDYVRRIQIRDFLPKNTTTALSVKFRYLPRHQHPSCGSSHNLPYDPWIRKHVRLGGRITKIAPSSMVVQGTFTEWQRWTGVDFHMVSQGTQGQELKLDLTCKRKYLEVAILGGLVPVKVYVEEKMCSYIEPNVWLYHEI
ncbi:hypothetical protein G7Y89_g8644 [Cudoniella acicularis]|uniref:Uncharacterized protein n=1 Tax=Cudoniella acicularis TaxID=354080 RepID=A0A8H4W2P3_9HELO|nr:hypothetical protein G7Y89_g8644 [Cudoniella acicularis]